MDRISGFPDELLVKILSFVPTKVAVSTSVLSKRWECLWMWVPKLDCDCSEPALRDFIAKNLPVRAPIIESLCLTLERESFNLEDITLWVGIAVSRCLRELSIDYDPSYNSPDLVFPRSLFTCKSLVTLKLKGENILVDVPQTVCLPSLKTMHLRGVRYLNEGSLWLLLSDCPVLEDLVIERDDYNDDNLKKIVVVVPSLLRLSLQNDGESSEDGYGIVTPSLKHFKFEDDREMFPALIGHMPS